MSQPPATPCRCGTDLPPHSLACPVCNRLVHADRLRELSAEATELKQRGDLRAALSRLRTALALLPPQTIQHERLHTKASSLSDAIDAGGHTGPSEVNETRGDSEEPMPDKGTLVKVGALAGGAALVFWKLKFVIVFLATKAKLLLLGLTKSTTLFSMLLSLGLYWSLWGWRFALGLVLSIYVHEIGHVAAMRRFGIPASAPMFLPGLGAVVRMDAYPQTAREDARIGLAGPVWGLACALAVAAAFAVTGWPILAAVASVAAWINLFNLVPFWQLDGARGFRALSKSARWGGVAISAACAFVYQEGLYVLIGLAAVVAAFSATAPVQSDRRTMVEFVVLLVLLGLVSKLPVPI